jgi:hypothetical protein
VFFAVWRIRLFTSRAVSLEQVLLRLRCRAVLVAGATYGSSLCARMSALRDLRSLVYAGALLLGLLPFTAYLRMLSSALPLYLLCMPFRLRLRHFYVKDSLLPGGSWAVQRLRLVVRSKAFAFTCV